MGDCRWGFLSTASIGHKNWQAIKKSGNGVVVAVASRSRESSQNFIDLCQAQIPFAEKPEALEGYDQLIQHPNVDAVYVPLPTGLRKEWVIKAANAGKHVMCEKPCAVSAADLEEMIGACHDNNVQFMDGVMYMHSQRMEAVREALNDPANVGEIKRITSQFSFCAPEEFRENNIRTDSRLEPHGCLGDLGWYTIRFALWTMNFQLPKFVTGRILEQFHRPESPAPVPMEFSGELIFENGVSSSFYNSFLTQHQQWANVSGTNGYLHIPDFVLPYYGNELRFFLSNAVFSQAGCDFLMENYTRRIGVSEFANSAENSQETNLFRTFNQLVVENKTDQHWPDIALKTQKVLDACLNSARNNNVAVEL